MKLTAIFLSALFLSVALFADDIIEIPGPSLDGVTLGEPVYNGSGCEIGTLGAILDVDQKNITLLFDNYNVEAGGTKRTDRKNCGLAIPLHIPEGLNISVLGTEIEGYNELPEGAESVLTAEYFFAGSQGPIFKNLFAGPLSESFSVLHAILSQDNVKSGCTGRDVNLRVNTSLRVKTNAAGDLAFSSIDTAHMSSNLVVQLGCDVCPLP